MARPEAPTELVARPMWGAALLTWRDNALDEQGFEVERASGGTFRRIASVAFDTAQHFDPEARPGQSYVYRVRAVAPAGPSAWSNEASVTPLVEPSDGGAPRDAPEADAAPPADAGGGVSFRRDIVPIFARSCGNGNSGCHSRFAFKADRTNGCRGWLSLADEQLGSRNPENDEATGCPDLPLYERLVRLTAWQCEPLRRYVTPGAPAQSQIYSVISGNPGAGGACNRAPGVPLGPMPPPGSDYTVSPDSVRLIEAWIRADAPNN
ncbi:MAG: fibronectin type III domain-containing protein [Deltaproteobacteria bacterium]|nr:fibronectin type III domain-containing protein [Deltaproteobacteria bacterium]